MDKSESEYRHSVRRARERYPYFPAEWLVRTVRRLIHGGDSLHLYTATRRKTHHVVVVENHAILAVYDKHRKQIVTVLPSLNAWEYPLDDDQYAGLCAYTEGALWEATTA